MLDRPGGHLWVHLMHLDTRTAARQLQNIRLGSGEANLLNGSLKWRADRDGCVEFASDAGVAHGASRFDGWSSATRRGLSDRVLNPLHPSDSASDGSPGSRF